MAFVILIFLLGVQNVENEIIKFEERVREAIISYAQKYKDYYVNYEYLILSKAFVSKKYYILSAKEDNFLHLTGVNSLLSAKDFYQKCLKGTLSTDDFNFNKNGQDVTSVKGSVRRKINVMDYTIGMFDSYASIVKVEEDFQKNAIKCSFAAGNQNVTFGFTINEKVRPKTLLKGYELNDSKSYPIDLVLRIVAGQDKFDILLYGQKESCKDYHDIILENCSDELISSIFDDITALM